MRAAVHAGSYDARRGEIEQYFDRTAAEAWAKLTSDAPVSGIRATVRAGREEMRRLLLSWLPGDMSGRRLLDAGCGTGALAVEAAERGAEVLAVDISATLVTLARQRAEGRHGAGRVTFRVGDMLDPALGEFDHAVAMDSLIHYRANDVVSALGRLALRVRRSILFTFAPRTPLLAVMHVAGRAFPRGDRAPAIEPVSEGSLRARIAAAPALAAWRVGRTQRVARGFYTSQAMELLPR
ncbi:MAG: magnesium protoporphyrin IX methyltransferase [Acetobacteraceae bacterium]|nr:magnesium protoporphyrin IX methyltransferase [Acetobacteraceae bacterium]MCX7683851.1 magnesium protoporphyrin IX methyltransferase [Acetobacteraceae bacterium]